MTLGGSGASFTRRAALAIVNAFSKHRNPILLDISLDMVQMFGPLAFLTGRPDAATAARLPTFL